MDTLRPDDFPLGSGESRAAARAMLASRLSRVPKFIWFFQPNEPADSLPTYEDLATDTELLGCVWPFERVLLMDENFTLREFSPTYEELLQGRQTCGNCTSRWKDKGRYYLRYRPGCASVGVLAKTSKRFRRIMERKP